jgi:pimeloyl-ACP methyl ester carboxylesterase
VLHAQYRSLRTPVLALSGGEPDQWSFLSDDDRHRRLEAMDDVEHHVVAGAGHYIHVEQPEVVTEHVRRFFDRS